MQHDVFTVRVEYRATIEARDKDDAENQVLMFLIKHPGELSINAYHEHSFEDLEPKKEE